MFHPSHTLRLVGAEILEKLLHRREVIRASFTGALRRKKEFIDRIDLIVSSDSPETLIRNFPDIAELSTRNTASETPIPSQEQGRTTYDFTLNQDIALRLNIIPDDRFSLLLLQLTGNETFLKQLSERATQFGIKISTYGLFLDDHLLPCQEETDLFSMLGLKFIPPELRKGRGEIEAAYT